MNDYENLTNPITSLAGGTTVSGSVDIVNDNINEGSELFSLHIHNCTNTAADGCSVTMPYALINITDDDSMYCCMPAMCSYTLAHACMYS